jgi:hypothetical protein
MGILPLSGKRMCGRLLWEQSFDWYRKYLSLPYGLGHPLIVSATKVQRIDEICKQMYLKCTQTKNFEIFSYFLWWFQKNPLSLQPVN